MSKYLAGLGRTVHPAIKRHIAKIAGTNNWITKSKNVLYMIVKDCWAAASSSLC
jgi:hypothetical protein